MIDPEHRAALETLIEHRNAVATKRNQLMGEVMRMDDEIATFDNQIALEDERRAAAELYDDTSD